MNCLEFDRLLDDGTPEALSVAAHAHALDCVRCTGALRRARSLERALERHFGPADPLGHPGPDAAGPSPGFADRVLARVAIGEARQVRWQPRPDPSAWWVRAAREPAVVSASAVAALVLWRGDLLLRVADPASWASDWAPRWKTVVDASAVTPLAHALATALVPGRDLPWTVALGLALGLAPVLALAALALWRLGERMVGGMGLTPAR